jgi:hypothetical protein
VGQFSPLSPGCPNSTRRLQELFGLFRNDSLGRTNTEGPDELLSQVGGVPASCSTSVWTRQQDFASIWLPRDMQQRIVALNRQCGARFPM